MLNTQDIKDYSFTHVIASESGPCGTKQLIARVILDTGKILYHVRNNGVLGSETDNLVFAICEYNQ